MLNLDLKVTSTISGLSSAPVISTSLITSTSLGAITSTSLGSPARVRSETLVIRNLPKHLKGLDLKTTIDFAYVVSTWLPHSTRPRAVRDGATPYEMEPYEMERLDRCFCVFRAIWASMVSGWGLLEGGLYLSYIYVWAIYVQCVQCVCSLHIAWPCGRSTSSSG